MNRSLAISSLLFLALATLPLQAADTAATHKPGQNLSNLHLAKRTGVWLAGQRFGYFQVLVWRVGLEHARDTVEVRITETDPERGTHRLLRRVTLPVPGIRGHVEDLELRMSGNRLFVALDIEMKAMDGVVLREAWLVSHDGGLERLQEARYRDIGDTP